MYDCKFVRVKSIFLAAALVWLLPIFATAQHKTTQMTATEIFDPMDILNLGGGPVGAATNPGTVMCPGAQPTENPMQPCPPGSRIHLRGMSGNSKMISQNPLLSGEFQWELNANFDATGSGHARGTFRLELDSGGVWEGSWTNQRSKVENLNAWVGRARFVGRGTSGRVVNNMHLQLTGTGSTFTLLPVAWVGVFDAEMFPPHCR